jgi:hypothetical protein
VNARGHRARRLVDVKQCAIEAIGKIDKREQQLPLGLPGGHVAIAFDPALSELSNAYRKEFNQADKGSPLLSKAMAQRLRKRK